jgi:hypothetical protein
VIKLLTICASFSKVCLDLGSQHLQELVDSQTWVLVISLKMLVTQWALIWKECNILVNSKDKWYLMFPWWRLLSIQTEVGCLAGQGPGTKVRAYHKIWSWKHTLEVSQLRISFWENKLLIRYIPLRIEGFGKAFLRCDFQASIWSELGQAALNYTDLCNHVFFAIKLPLFIHANYLGSKPDRKI